MGPLFCFLKTILVILSLTFRNISGRALFDGETLALLTLEVEIKKVAENSPPEKFLQ